MSLETVTVTWTEQDIGQAPLGGNITFTLNEPVADSASGIDYRPVPKTYFFTSATGTSDPLLANDDPTLQPAGSHYTITVAITGQAAYTFTSQILFANGASQTLAFLQANAAVPAAQFSAYLPLPTGTPAAGQVPVVQADGNTQTAWGSGGGGGGGNVDSVTAADTSIVVGGTLSNPTVRTGTLDVIAADHPPAANWSNNSKKITAVANGTASTDAAAFGQIPTALPPNGTASGDLSGTYPAPAVAKVNGLAVGTSPGGTTDFLRADGTWAAPPGGGGGTVDSVTAGDASVTVGGTASDPTVETGRLDQIATLHPPTAAVAMNSQKLTGLASGSASGDSVAFGQLGTAAFQASSAFDAAGAAAAAQAAAEAASDPAGSASAAQAASLQKTSNLSDVANAATARTNLGLGTAATQGVTLSPSGLTGATAVSRYAGATTLNAPTSGTFALGDFIVDLGGAIWVCAAAGSPGTWNKLAGRNNTAGNIAPSPGTQAAGSVGSVADTGHVHGQPPMFAPTGLTGATAASRYVGGTASGAPASGTFAVGDFVTDQTGKAWICTGAGTPGTWVQAGAGTFLPLAGGTMSGPIAMGSSKVTGLANGSAASDAAAFGQIPTALPPNGAAGGVLSGTYPSPGFATTPLPQSGGTMTGWLAPAVVSLTFGSSIALNAALGNAFAVTLTASTGTLSNPTNPVDGQTIRVRVIQDGTGSRTLAFGTAYDFGAAGAPTLSTAASKVDILGFEYAASLSKWCYLGSGLGF